MSIHRKLTTVCCAAVFALGLAACGSSDNKVDSGGTPSGTPGGGMGISLDELKAGEIVMAGTHLITGDESDLTALYTALAALENVPEDGYEPGAPAVNVGGLMLMCSENSVEKCTLEIDEDESTITVTGTILVAAEDGAFPDDRTDAQKMADAAVGTEAATKAAGTKVKAIRVEAGRTTVAGLGGRDAAGVAIETYMLEITRDRDGTEVEIEITDAADDDPKFMQAMDFEDGRTMHVRAMEADADGNVVEEVVIVKTDIAAPSAKPFKDVEDLDLSTNTMNDALTETHEALVVAAGSGDVNLPKIKSAAFVPGPGTMTSLTFARAQEDGDGETDGAQPVTAFETEGTYNGATGTYKCNSDSADCTVSINTMGEITAVSAGWIFTPATGANVHVADANYLRYGFWLKKTTDADGATTYNEVETFADMVGHSPTENDIETVTGRAEYEGGSVGVYVKNVLDGEGNITSATSGHFSADVALTANFGGGNVPLNNQFAIEGTVTGFVLANGEENDWAVKLGLADFSGRAEGEDPGESVPGNNKVGIFDGETTGDSTAASGTWNGTFYGVVGQIDHDENSDTPAINTSPAAVTGEFNANFTDGTAAGGFGANKM